MRNIGALHLQTMVRSKCIRRWKGVKRMSQEHRLLNLRFGTQHRADDEGQAIVEMALAAPILLGLTVAIYQLGLAFNHQILLTQAVDAGARQLQQASGESGSSYDPCAVAFAAITSAAPSLEPTKIVQTLSVNNSPSITAQTCSYAQSLVVSKGPLKVSATYPYSLSLLGIPAVSGTLEADSTESAY